MSEQKEYPKMPPKEEWVEADLGSDIDAGTSEPDEITKLKQRVAQLEAEREDLGAVIVEAVDDIKRSQKGYTEGPTIEGVLAMLLVRAAALSEQEEKDGSR